MPTETPSVNGPNGRDTSGKFVRGCPGGPGNPHAKKVAQLRAGLLRGVTAADVRDIVRKRVELAKAGDVAAAKLVLDRTLGKPDAIDVLCRIEELEKQESHE